MKLDAASARMTVFLMWSSVGRWFLALLFGCYSAQRFSAASSVAIYAACLVGVAVANGQGRCGCGGTGSMIGLLAASRIGEVNDGEYDGCEVNIGASFINA